MGDERGLDASQPRSRCRVDMPSQESWSSHSKRFNWFGPSPIFHPCKTLFVKWPPQHSCYTRHAECFDFLIPIAVIGIETIIVNITMTLTVFIIVTTEYFKYTNTSVEFPKIILADYIKSLTTTYCPFGFTAQKMNDLPITLFTIFGYALSSSAA